MSSSLRRFWMPLTFVSLSVVGAGTGAEAGLARPGVAAAAARAALFEVMHEDRSWAKIHAAEVLLIHGEADRVRDYFLGELPERPLPLYRVGLWRVLAVAARDRAERTGYVAKILAVLVDPAAPDRGAAVESLAKLGEPLTDEALSVVTRLEAEAVAAEQPVPRWALYQSGRREMLPQFAAGLESPDPVVRRRSGYVLRWLRITDAEILRQLVRAAEIEPAGTDTHDFLVSAVVSLRAAPAAAVEWSQRLAKVWETGSSAARYEASQTLGRSGAKVALAPLEPRLADPDADTRVGAADLILSGVRANAP